MEMFFKSEYVTAMFNSKYSRLMSRILCIVDIFTQKRDPEGQSPILLVEKVKKIKALRLKYPNYHSDSNNFLDLAPPLGKWS